MRKRTSVFLRKFAATRTWFWLLAIVVVIPLYVLNLMNLNKMAFIILEISLYANMESAWTNYQAARTEVKQDIDVGSDEPPG